MEKFIFIFLFSLISLGCADNTSDNQTRTAIAATETQSEIGRSNFAVTWKWTTENVQFVVDNSPVVSEELIKLWNQDIVENAYFDADSPTDKLAHLPNITFFIKAFSETEARSILDDLTIVQKGIAAYQLHPVGLLWLNRNNKAINQNGITNSFVAIWETKRSLKTSDPLLKAQNDKALALWNAGKIENVYFDNAGTNRTNDITDFVFFVNANTRAEAEAICNSLPFFEEKVADYKMYQVGTFWMGRKKDQ